MVASVYAPIPGKVDCCEVIRPDGHVDVGPIGAGALIIVHGWLFDEGVALKAVWVTIDGRTSVPVERGYDRPDVRAHLGVFDPTRKVGFRAIATLEDVAIGEHTLTVEAIDAGGRFYRGDGEPYTLVVVENADEGRVLAQIDEVRIDDIEVDASSPIQVAKDCTVFVRGWAITADLRAGLAVFLGANEPIAAQYGIERPDLAAAYGEGCRFAGFSDTFSGSDLISHTETRVAIILLDADGINLRESDAALEILERKDGVDRANMSASQGVPFSERR